MLHNSANMVVHMSCARASNFAEYDRSGSWRRQPHVRPKAYEIAESLRSALGKVVCRVAAAVSVRPVKYLFLPSPLFSARRRLCLVPVFWFSAKSTLPAGFGPSTLGREQYSAKTSPSVKRLSPSFSSTRQNRKFQ